MSGYREWGGAGPGVAAFWALERGAGQDGAMPYRVLPDGCVDLIFRYWRAGDGRLHDPRLIIAGPAMSSDVVDIEPGDGFVGVRFSPGWGGRCLGVDPQAIAGTVVPAEGFGRLVQQLTHAGPDAARSFTAAMAGLAAAHRPGRAQEAIRRLHASHGTADLTRLARALGVSPRTLRREVVAAAGLSPKALARVFRFHHAVRLAEGGVGCLAEVAASAGFADQAHMTREFRTLGGFTPAGSLGRFVQDGGGAAVVGEGRG